MLDKKQEIMSHLLELRRRVMLALDESTLDSDGSEFVTDGG